MTEPLRLVETIYETNASNIADMLRQAADTIEAETGDDVRTDSIIAVQLMENGEVQLYGWGKTDTYKAIGTLQIGIHKMAQGALPV